jgi:hypothetical protein
VLNSDTIVALEAQRCVSQQHSLGHVTAVTALASHSNCLFNLTQSSIRAAGAAAALLNAGECKQGHAAWHDRRSMTQGRARVPAGNVHMLESPKITHNGSKAEARVVQMQWEGRGAKDSAKESGVAAGWCGTPAVESSHAASVR